MKCPNCLIELKTVNQDIPEENKLLYKCEQCGFNIPANDLVIEEMWAFVSVDDNGNEGIITMRAPDGAYMPLVCADIHRVNNFKEYVEYVTKTTGRKANLIKFSSRETIESYGE